MIDYIALVRCSPSSPDAGEVARVLGEGAAARPRSLTFLHGDATAFAATDAFARLGGELHVCRTSWRRRFGDRRPSAPFVESGLASLFGALPGVGRVDSFGVAGHCCSVAGPRGDGGASGDTLFEIAFEPASGEQATEALELVLGAAALEIPCRVLFSGPGAAHLDRPSGRGWRQLTDFGLARVFREGPRAAAGPDGPAEAVDRFGAMTLRSDARTIVLA